MTDAERLAEALSRIDELRITVADLEQREEIARKAREEAETKLRERWNQFTKQTIDCAAAEQKAERLAKLNDELTSMLHGLGVMPQ